MKIDWGRKLSSRKFWAASTGYVTAILTAFNVADSTVTRVVALLAGVGALCVYILAEAAADAASENKEESEK